MTPTDKQQLIRQLALEPHVEGGYFRRSYAAPHSVTLDDRGERLLMSSIYYLLTEDSPVGHFHCNRSDIIHYWHRGWPLTYYLIDPQGALHTAVLGPDLEAGEQLQLMVPGGWWKASRLECGDYGLLSEAVSPGFDFTDMSLATAESLRTAFPDLWQQQGALLTSLCKA